MRRFVPAFVISALLLLLASAECFACTGITLTATDGSRVVARTVEWAASPMQCGYVVVPRGYQLQSLTPEGQDGLSFTSRYGYVGIWTEYEAIVVEGVNEKGLSAGLFFFPNYGKYPDFDAAKKSSTLSDMQLVSWILSQFSTIDEVKEAISGVRVAGLDSRIGTVHWRISEPGGRVVVLEFTGGEPHFYENPLGVLTNSPGFEWQMLNLNNYVNLVPGSVGANRLAEGVVLNQFGGNSAMLGLPGDFTPPSRFVRAAFFQTSAPVWPTGFDTVCQAFHILNNFDVPVGVQRGRSNVSADGSQEYNPANLQSATQFTSASDLKALRFYYRTAWNSNIRCIDLKAIDFGKVAFQKAPLDPDNRQPVEMVAVK